MQSHENEYTDDFIAKLELLWGEGFLSPGGPEETARILEGTDLAGRDVMDIGCGIGGIDVILVRDYGAATVTGLDVEEPLVRRARDRAARAGLADRITIRLVEPGPFPCPDASFDVVFSKDSMIHIADKQALFAEVLRVLRPGGVFLASDWMQSAAGPDSPEMATFVETSGLTFSMGIADELPAILKSAGFTDTRVVDRNPWYREEARNEVARMRGELREDLLDILGRDKADRWIAMREAMIAALDAGAFRPTHFRAVKPN
ncbi:MAG: methyltransferase domain-containing protein [Alphaproteobacteria bacterium]|nr:methyltransferase domain-containing protein [Alphaproteobacteria bacterium]